MESDVLYLSDDIIKQRRAQQSQFIHPKKPKQSVHHVVYLERCPVPIPSRRLGHSFHHKSSFSSWPFERAGRALTGSQILACQPQFCFCRLSLNILSLSSSLTLPHRMSLLILQQQVAGVPCHTQYQTRYSHLCDCYRAPPLIVPSVFFIPRSRVLGLRPLSQSPRAR